MYRRIAVLRVNRFTQTDLHIFAPVLMSSISIVF